MTRPLYVTDEAVKLFIQAALKEDIGEGDHSTNATIPESKISKAKLIVKSDGILAGAELARMIFHQFDASLQIQFFKKDGYPIKHGDIVFEVSGHARSILTTERLVLNCMQRMSGIATYTHRLCEILKSTSTQLLDTRKTTPNFRLPEKWAVNIGGGKNHRFALYDMVMLKDNHIDVAGGIENAVALTRNYLSDNHKELRIEVETRTLEEVKTALQNNADIIMLDNMSIDEIKEAVSLINGKCKTEASGGITEHNLLEVANCGVDYISVGALTHSVKSLDLSLKIF